MWDTSRECILPLTVGEQVLTVLYSLAPPMQPVGPCERTRNAEAMYDLTVRKRTTHWHSFLGIALCLGAVLATS